MKNKKLLLLIVPLMAFVSCAGNNATSNSISSNDLETSHVVTTKNEVTTSSEQVTTSDKTQVTTEDNTTSKQTTQNQQTSSQTTSKNNTTSEKPATTSQKPTTSSQTGGKIDTDALGLPKNMTKSKGYPVEKSGDIYLSPTGSDANTGDKNSPLYSLSVAISKAKPGTTIFMNEGQYNYSSTIEITTSGTSDNPIVIQAVDYKEVIIDFKGIPYGRNQNGWGIRLKGNYWHFQGLTLQYAGDNAIKVEGSYNYIGRCITHHNGDTGIQLGFGHETNKNNPGNLCAYNTIENCDSYKNYDFDNHGDADGFACKMHNGEANVFIGCRAWENCDDAWDLYETNFSVYIVNCWAFNTALKSALQDFDQAYLSKNNIKVNGVGNGNGIKLGGNGAGGNSEGQHYVYNCVSFNNNISTSVKGFDENNHKKGNIVKNCVAWDNGYNFMFEDGGSDTELRNNISFYTLDGNKSCKPGRMAGETSGGTIVENNNFKYDGGDLAQTINVTKDDFITCSVEDAKAPRQADGSLPNNGFAKLKETSSLYNKGMGLAF